MYRQSEKMISLLVKCGVEGYNMGILSYAKFGPYRSRGCVQEPPLFKLWSILRVFARQERHRQFKSTKVKFCMVECTMDPASHAKFGPDRDR